MTRKRLIVLSLLLFSLAGLSSSVYKKIKYDKTGLPFSYDGKIIYVYCLPVDEYTEAGAQLHPSRYTEDYNKGGIGIIMRIVNEALEDEVKAQSKGRHDKDFDAIVFNHVYKGRLIKFKKSRAGLRESRVERRKEKDIYMLCWPGRRFNYVSYVNVSESGLGQANNTGDEMERMIHGVLDKSLRKLKKGELKDFDAILFGGDDPVQSSQDGINFSWRTGGNLIKYCDDGTCDSDSLVQAYLEKLYPKPSQGKAYSVCFLMSKNKTGGGKGSYAAFFVEVLNSKNEPEEKIIEQARQYRINNYSPTSHGYQEVKVLTDSSSSADFKKEVMSQHRISELRMDYLLYK
ncbi:MAG: hypothetical protein ACJ75J_04180 [Cytophagaceae bacterium]